MPLIPISGSHRPMAVNAASSLKALGATPRRAGPSIPAPSRIHSNRTGSAQIRIRRIDSGKDSQLAPLTDPPIALAWSPGGDAIAFTAIRSSASAPPWAPEAILRFLTPPPGHPQLFVIPVAGGPARQITTGDLNWIGEPAWMPDGRSILCAAAADPDPEHPLEAQRDLQRSPLRWRHEADDPARRPRRAAHSLARRQPYRLDSPPMPNRRATSCGICM